MLRIVDTTQLKKWLAQRRSQPLIELDAVGGTVLLFRAELHRQGLNFPAYPVEGFIETEALSKVARSLGIRSWALPQLLVHHA